MSISLLYIISVLTSHPQTMPLSGVCAPDSVRGDGRIIILENEDPKKAAPKTQRTSVSRRSTSSVDIPINSRRFRPGFVCEGNSVDVHCIYADGTLTIWCDGEPGLMNVEIRTPAGKLPLVYNVSSTERLPVYIGDMPGDYDIHITPPDQSDVEILLTLTE